MVTTSGVKYVIGVWIVIHPPPRLVNPTSVVMKTSVGIARPGFDAIK